MTDLAGYKAGRPDSEVVVAGILFKDMKNRTNVIEELIAAKGVITQSSGSEVSEAKSFATENDVIWLEENGMRVRLDLPAAQIARHATGFVIAARGYSTPDGHFHMTSFCLPRSLATVPRKPSSSTSSSFLVLCSGLAFGSAQPGLEEARARALNFLMGRGEETISINRIVVCGGSFAEPSGGQAGRKAAQAAVLEADGLFARLADTVPLSVMPGQGDPTNAALPQRPLHPYLLRQSYACKGFRAVSNPFSFEADGLSVLGHSGLPVRDLMRCASFSSAIEALTFTLEGRHLAPTAPDTIPMQPFVDMDPLVLDQVPHVLFSGGHDRPDHAWRPCPQGEDASLGTQCICVPAFHLHPSIVLVNVSDPRNVRIKDFAA